MSLVGWWKLDGNAEDSFGDYDGYEQGGPAYSRAKLGSGYDNTADNGTGVELIRHSDFKQFENCYSFSLWFKSTSTSSGYSAERIISRDASEYPSVGIDQTQTGSQDITLWNMGGSASAQVNEWHHLAFTIDVGANESRVFIDGELVGSGGTGESTAARPYVIGGNTEGDGDISGGHFIGKIDDVRLYDHVLSAKEVKQLSQGKVLHYKLDHNGYVSDSSGQGNDGALKSPSFTKSSAIGSGAYTFNGSGDMIPTELSYNRTDLNAVTVSAWYKSSSTADQIIASADRSEYWRLGVGSDGVDGVQWTVNGSDIVSSMSRSELQDGNWHHIVAVFDTSLANDHKIYIDGSLDTETSVYSSGIGSGVACYTHIGVGSEASSFDGATGPNDWMNGSLDDIRVYHTGLSSSEIRELYEQRGSIDGEGNLHTHEIQETKYDSLIADHTVWEVGTTGSQGDFTRNGAASENEIVEKSDPFGKQVPVWKCVPDSNSNADGGWNMTFQGDNSQRLRMTVFVKRTGNTNGQTYHGCDNGGNTLNLDGTSNGNPYFWSGDPPNLNEWYLLVGIVHPNGYQGSEWGSAGLYDLDGNQIYSGSEYKWGSGDRQELRDYLYYCTDTSERQYFVYPRVDVMDGTEPSIEALLSGLDSRNFDYLQNLDSSKPQPLSIQPEKTFISGVNEKGPASDSLVGHWKLDGNLKKAENWRTNTSSVGLDGNGNTVEIESISIESNGWFKVSYGCNWKSETAGSRHIMGNWLELNGSKINPSENRCYIRLDTPTNGHANSNSGTVMVKASEGDTLSLYGSKIAGSNGSTVAMNDHWLNITESGYKNAQVYDSSGGQDYDPGAVAVDMDSSTYLSDIYSHSGGSLEVNESGWYRFYYSVNCRDDNQGNRQSVRSWLRKNGGTNLKPSESYSYIRLDGSSGDRNHQTGYGLVNLSSGDYLDVMVKKQYQQSSGQSTTEGNRSWLMLDKVESNNFIQAYESGGGQSISNGSTNVVSLDSTDSSGPYLSFSSNRIEVNNSGHYEVSYVFGWDDNASNNRRTVDSWLRKNGTKKLNPSKQTGYTRGYSGGRLNSNSANFTTYLEEGDYIELLANPEGGSIEVIPNSVYITVNPIEKELVRDTSGKGNHGINKGATISSGLGQSAYDFKSSKDIVDLGNIGILEGEDEATISAWINAPSKSGHHRIISQEYVFYVGQYGGNLSFYLDDNGDAWSHSSTSLGNFPKNEWVFVTYVKDGTNAFAYVNGEQTGSMSAPSTLGSNDRTTLIGDFDSSSNPGTQQGNQSWSGKIQDLRVFNRALTVEEVKTLYNLTDPRKNQRIIQADDGTVYTKGEFNELL